MHRYLTYVKKMCSQRAKDSHLDSTEFCTTVASPLALLNVSRATSVDRFYSARPHAAKPDVNDASGTYNLKPQRVTFEDLSVLFYLAEVIHQHALDGWTIELLCFFVANVYFTQRTLVAFERVLIIATYAGSEQLYDAVVAKLRHVLVFSAANALNVVRIERFIHQCDLVALEPALSYRRLVDSGLVDGLSQPMDKILKGLRRRCMEGSIDVEEGMHALEALESLQRGG